jgi:subtilisin family serine protease
LKLFASSSLILLATVGMAQSTQKLTKDFKLKLPNAGMERDHMVPGLVLVKYKKARAIELTSSFSTEQTKRKLTKATGFDISPKTRIGNTGWVMYTIPSIINPNSVAADLMKNDRSVIAANPVYTVHSLIVEPNDLDFNAIEDREEYVLNFSENPADFRRCWHFDEIDAMGAWGVWPNQYYTAGTKPNNTPLIAILDSGVEEDHPDFINSGGSGSDITQGGQLDKSKHARIRLGEIIAGASVDDENGHGTHVAGLALAAANNLGFDGHGSLGTGYACKGMTVNVLDANGGGLDSDVAVAIMYAADQGADIINLSLGGTNFNPVLQDAVTYATEKGSLVVCAGNENGNGGGDLGPIYPAACTGALAVTANGPNGAFASYAGYGSYVDLGAPGGDYVQEGALGSDFVLKLQFDWSTGTTHSNYIIDNNLASPPYTNNFTYLAGTSMACPIVAGSLGMYMGKNNLRQGDWSNIRTYRAVERAADSKGAAFGGYEPTNGFGIFNFAALMTDTDTRAAVIGGAEGIVYSGGTAVANVSVRAQKLNSSGVASGAISATATNANGYYRFDGMTAGTYKIWAIAFGSRKDAYMKVVAGSDRSGLDFYCGNPVIDSDGPIVQRCNVAGAINSMVTVNHFAYDPETRLQEVTFAIKDANNAVVVPATRVYFEGPTEQLPVNLPNGSYTLVATYINGEGFTTVRNVPFNIGVATATVAGTINLQSYPSGTAREMVIQLRTPGTQTVVESFSLNCTNGTAFSINTTKRGLFDVAIKGAHFLRGVIPNVNITNAGVSGLFISLRNADINGDNSVSTADLNALRTAFGSTSASGNWNPMADLNGDGSVSTADLSILRVNFGQVGTP